MKDIVIEIDGVRHRIVEARDNSRCDTCSLEELCSKAWEQFTTSEGVVFNMKYNCDKFRFFGYVSINEKDLMDE